MKGVLFQRYVMSLTLTGGGGGGAAVKKVHVDYFPSGTLRTVCLHNAECEYG